MSEPNLTIETNDQLSINDLVELRDRGFSVLRSLHVGNLAPYNMTLLDAGIPAIAVDHNQTGIDKNYFPEMRMSRSGSQQVAELGKLSLRASAEGNGHFLDEYHLEAVRSAIPGAQIETNTEYLQRNITVARIIGNVAITYRPDLFDRLVQPDGTVIKDPRAAAYAASGDIMQISENPRRGRSALMPNAVDILANFAIEAIESGRDTQYHLSGPDMVKYVSGIQPDIEQLYDATRQSTSLGKVLPSRLSVVLVPTAEARFATTSRTATQLDRLVASYDAMQAETSRTNEMRKQFFDGQEARDDQRRQAFVRDMKTVEKAAAIEVAEASEFMEELFTEPKEPGFVTQYDAAAEGGLHVSDANRSRPMAELRAMSQTIKRLRGKFLR